MKALIKIAKHAIETYDKILDASFAFCTPELITDILDARDELMALVEEHGLDKAAELFARNHTLRTEKVKVWVDDFMAKSRAREAKKEAH